MSQNKQKTVHIITLGCPKNRVDSEVMLGGLVQDGWVLSDKPEEADVLVVNTCAFIEDSKTESVETILEAAKHKKSGRAKKLVVAGCLSQRYPTELARELPEVDHFIGTSAYAALPKLLADEHGAPRQVIPDPHYIHSATTPRVNSLPSFTAYLKVSEGCDNDCAFCVIPKLRGAQRSRPVSDIVLEAENLAASGARELNLVAQDLTAYGYDLPARPKLHELIKALGEVSGVRWLRLHYAYPRNFSDALINTIRDTPSVVKYVDMPVQHASDRLLRAMRRGRNIAFIRELLEKLRSRIPGIAIRTSLIVGLPGETAADFKELLVFMREQRFERLGIFTYSQEEGTLAASMPKQVPEELKQERFDTAMELQASISREHHAMLVGKELEVLVEGVHEETEHLLVGRHAGQAPEIDGNVILNDLGGQEIGPGDIVRVRIEEAHEYDLVGCVQSIVVKAIRRDAMTRASMKLPVIGAQR